MKEISETWYTIKRHDGVVYETADKGDVRLAIREGLEVFKTMRKAFTSGSSNVYLTVITEIKKIKDI